MSFLNIHVTDMHYGLLNLLIEFLLIKLALVLETAITRHVAGLIQPALDVLLMTSIHSFVLKTEIHSSRRLVDWKLQPTLYLLILVLLISPDLKLSSLWCFAEKVRAEPSVNKLRECPIAPLAGSLLEDIFGSCDELSDFLSILRELLVSHLLPRGAICVLSIVTVKELAVKGMANLHGCIFDQLLIMINFFLKLLSFPKLLLCLQIDDVLHIPLVPREHVTNSHGLCGPILYLLLEGVIINAVDRLRQYSWRIRIRPKLFGSFLLLIILIVTKECELSCVLSCVRIVAMISHCSRRLYGWSTVHPVLVNFNISI